MSGFTDALTSAKNSVVHAGNSALHTAQDLAAEGENLLKTDSSEARKMLKIVSQIMQVAGVVLTAVSAATVLFALAHLSMPGVLLGTLATALSRDLFLFSREMEQISGSRVRYHSIFGDADTRMRKLLTAAAKPTLIFKPILNTVYQIAPPAA